MKSQETSPSEILSVVEFPDGTKPLVFDRRDFLRITATTTAAVALASAGCKMPVETVVPSVERPEELRALGRPLFYSTTLHGRPVRVRTREGRPILVEPNREHPSGTSPSIRAQAAILDIYDPDRAEGPLALHRGKRLPASMSWEQAGKAVFKEIERATSKGAGFVMLGRPESGPATRSALSSFCETLGGRLVEWSPRDTGYLGRAWKACFGLSGLPTPRFEHARIIVGLGAEFLDDPQSNEPASFARSREPDRPEGMSRFVAFEGRLSLTGANSDLRVRVRPSQLPALALGLVRELVVQRGLGPLGGDAELGAALAGHDLGSTAKLTGVSLEQLQAVVESLAGAQGESLVLTGETVVAQAGGETLALAVNLLNHSLGNIGKTLIHEWATPTPEHGLQELLRLVEDMNAGRVGVLFLQGVNPVFDSPESLGFAAAIEKVPLVVSFADRVDETAALADYLAPLSHEMESWGDATHALGSVLGLRQPSIQPLHDTRGLLDLLVGWGAPKAGEASALGVAWAASRGVGAVQSPGYHFLRKYWEQVVLPRRLPSGGDFETFWNETLRLGHASILPHPPQPHAYDKSPLLAACRAVRGLSEGFELQLFPHYVLGDGSSNNNGWLMELADPITRIAWSDWVAMAPRTFDAMGLQNGDLLELTLNGRKLRLPVYRQAGMHEKVLAAPLGLGRSAVGLVGNGIGTNLFRAQLVEGTRLYRAGLAVQVRATGEHRPLPVAQGSEVIDRQARPLVPATTLAEYKNNPSSGTEQTAGGPSVYPPVPYPKQRWAMAIDLSRCNGCGQCTLACRGENNIPVVGEKGFLDRREMSWLRIDRYWDAPKKAGEWPDSVWDGPLEVVEEPKTLFEPMMCQHCENAVCETVCPFAATMHSSDGLNQQVYNRCVGTFFCANNCPFKVRRFNWYDYSSKRSSAFFTRLVPIMKRHALLNAREQLQLKNNPEVTVRSRGVMEKCSFCVQRIREAREQAAVEGRDPEQLRDGEVMPACMASCPTGAIVFGNVNDPNSRVAQLAASPRAMKLLELIGVKPSVSYLAKVRNES